MENRAHTSFIEPTMALGGSIPVSLTSIGDWKPPVPWDLMGFDGTGSILPPLFMKMGSGEVKRGYARRWGAPLCFLDHAPPPPPQWRETVYPRPCWGIPRPVQPGAIT